MPGWTQINVLLQDQKARSRATSLLWLLLAVVSCMILYSAFCAFTWKKFQLVDYGIYTNMIWNCGHGRPFLFLVDSNYLHLHLSFTLALLAPLFWIWNHPFLLSLVQWILAIGGILILTRSAIRLGVSPAMAAAISLALMCSPLYQAVLLCEFHGVALMLFLVPWLYYELQFRKRFAWLPLLLILGLREDAFLAVLPILVYFTIRDRWRGGWIITGFTLLYGALALWVLFPWLVNQPVLGGRPISQTSILAGLVKPGGMELRFWALLLVVLPVLPLIRWSRPVWIFISLAFLAAMLSPFPNQFALRFHYPAAILACLSVGLVEAASRMKNSSAITQRLVIAGLLLVGACTYFTQGFLIGGPKSDRVYRTPHPEGIQALDVVRHIPRSGILMTEAYLAGFCANRADLMTLGRRYSRTHSVDCCFIRLRDLAGRHGQEYRRLLESGEFGVTYFDESFIVMEKGKPKDNNAKVFLILDELRRKRDAAPVPTTPAN